jgi:subtilisin family serine protease
VENLTTDVSGPGGYRSGPDGDYVPNFRGTSSSTPIVAGAAALVLSANPCLTEEQVRQILCSTAFKKTKTVPFVDGHNERMGFGRVDVLAAVNEALKMRAAGGAVPCNE